MKKSHFFIIGLLLLGTLLLNCCEQAKTDQCDRFGDPDLLRYFRLHSEYALGEDYLVQVRLPGNYYDSDRNYPVFYLTDADVLFGIADNMQHHIEFNRGDFILVGIGYGTRELCWENRRKDFTADFYNADSIPGYALFMKFMEKELFPEVESRYRADPSARTLFGWSSGFQFCCHVLYEKRSLFENYVMGGGIFPQNWTEDLVPANRVVLKEEPTGKPLKVYVGHPEHDAPVEVFKKSLENMKKQGFADMILKYDVFKDRYHEFPAVSDLLAEGMEYTYLNKGMDQLLYRMLQQDGFETAMRRFENWRNNRPDLGFDNSLILKNLSKKAAGEGKAALHMSLRTYIKEHYPLHEIKFLVTADTLPDGTNICITGNHDALSNWDPAGVILVREPDGKYSASFRIEEGTPLEYKFTLGSWEHEALDENGDIPPNSELTVSGDRTINVHIPGWRGVDGK